MSSVESSREGKDQKDDAEGDAQQTEEERQQAEEMKEEAMARAREKQEFRQKNRDAASNTTDRSELKKLDGSVKKNSVFVKKLRTLTEQQRASLTSDFESLNLTRYIGEAATGIAEAKIKLVDVGCAVHMCSLLHGRYSEFSGLLLEQLQRIYSPPLPSKMDDEDRAANVTKFRLGLRLLGELVLGGLVDEDVGLSLLRDMLHHVAETDRLTHGRPYLTVVLSFARHHAEDFAAILPRRQQLLLRKYSIKLPNSQLVPRETRGEFRKMFRSYFKLISAHLQSERRSMNERERRNLQILQNKGELSEERRTGNENAQKAYDKLLTNTNALAVQKDFGGFLLDNLVFFTHFLLQIISSLLRPSFFFLSFFCVCLHTVLMYDISCTCMYMQDILNEEMPELEEFKPPQPQSSDISIELQIPAGLTESVELNPSSLWEDEDSYQFYVGVADIRPFVPAILFEGKKRGTSESSDTAAATPASDGGGGEAKTEGDDKPEEEDEAKVLEQVIRDTEEISLDEEVGVEEEEGGEGGEGGDKGGGAPLIEPGSAIAILEEFITRLPNLMNRKFVDEFAVEFCMSMNFKGNRARLARALFNVDKNRMDLIPFYARLVATLAPCVDDLAPLLVDMLLRDFRFQVRKKDQIHIHSKIKNCRFIGEPSRVQVGYWGDVLCLHDFTHHNIDMACTFIEHCGRYLLRSADSHLRAKALLEIMVRKKRVQRLDGRQRSLVENALHCANPPLPAAREVVVLPPMLEYIQRLLFKELNRTNTEKILRQMRKLDWNDPEVVQFGVTSLSQVWRLKFSNIHCLANLLAGLRAYQEDAVFRAVDSILEDIRLGLEINHPKFNQRRVSCVKFLGEMYNYQLIESNVVFRVLYLLISFGWNVDGSPSPLDPYDNYFRVRLVCTLLDTCGQYFDRGSGKRKMDCFLVFFQCYIFRKRQPVPLELEHLVADTLEPLRPDLPLYSTAQEAYEAAAELEKKYKDKIEEEVAEEERGGGASEEEEEEEDDEEEGDDDEEENEEDDERNAGIPDDEPEAVIKHTPKYIHTQEDEDFLANLDKMMADDLQQRRQEGIKVSDFDVGVPLTLMGGQTRGKSDPLVHEEGELRMKFKVVMRKGHNKQQVKELNIPLDSGLASSLQDTQRAMKDERHEMKKLVLAYEQRQEEEDYSAMVATEKEKIQQNKKVLLYSDSVPQQRRSQQQHGKQTSKQTTQQTRQMNQQAKQPTTQQGKHASKQTALHTPSQYQGQQQTTQRQQAPGGRGGATGGRQRQQRIPHKQQQQQQQLPKYDQLDA
ncbi:Regulator of nonsense transcripts 2 [Geodia barretti]|nr:Regulator of nonsense transcripts 2 [Geodia barretti]